MGDNVWRDEMEWPLARTEWTSYYLHGSQGDRTLSTDLPGDEPPDVFEYNPNDAVPGPMAIGPTYNDAPDLNEIGSRRDVLAYTTATLTRDTEITGPVTLDLWASTSAPSTDFTATLIEVFSDGVAVSLAQGVVRTAAAADTPTAPGSIGHYSIDLAATSVVVKARHRLVLQLSSSQYPTFELNPNTGQRITDSAEVATATQRIFHDSQNPSRLFLPIIPR
jgi:putative CocE/NonD family hydrolase